MNCAFCRIVAGEVEAEVVFGGARMLSHFSTTVLFPGHVLLIPRSTSRPWRTFPQRRWGRCSSLRRDWSGPSSRAQRRRHVHRDQQQGQPSVPHLHIHIVPRRKGDGLKGFFWPRRGYDSDEHLRETAAGFAQR